MIHFLFRNTDVGELTLFSEMFIEKKLNKYLRQNIIDRLNWHQKNKHITVLISASLDIYIEPWARKFNFSFVESTVLGKYKNLCTGKIEGANCYGIEKVNRLNKIFKNKLEKYETYGYGDGIGDRFFIELCDYKFFKSDLQNI